MSCNIFIFNNSLPQGWFVLVYLIINQRVGITQKRAKCLAFNSRVTLEYTASHAARPQRAINVSIRFLRARRCGKKRQRNNKTLDLAQEVDCSSSSGRVFVSYRSYRYKLRACRSPCVRWVCSLQKVIMMICAGLLKSLDIKGLPWNTTFAHCTLFSS